MSKSREELVLPSKRIDIGMHEGATRMNGNLGLAGTIAALAALRSCNATPLSPLLAPYADSLKQLSAKSADFKGYPLKTSFRFAAGGVHSRRLGSGEIVARRLPVGLARTVEWQCASR
jgi:hypothetical protein